MTDRGRQRDKYKEKRGYKDTKTKNQKVKHFGAMETPDHWKTLLHKNVYATLTLVFASSDRVVTKWYRKVGLENRWSPF